MFRKRNIMIANIVLFVLFSLTCYSTIRSFVPEKEVEAADIKVEPRLEVAKVDNRLPRSEYKIITEKNIFDAKLIPPAAPTVEVPPEPLKWTLKAVMKIGGEKIALIDMVTSTAPARPRRPKRRGRSNPTVARVSKRVKEGDVILDYEVKILEINIENKYVKYERTHNGKVLEPDYLYQDGKRPGSIFERKRTYTSLVARLHRGRNEYNLSRSELKKEIKDVAAMMELLEFEPQTDPKADNRVAGLKIKNVKNEDMLSAFGLAKKDVLVKVNGLAIDSIDKLKEILDSLGDKDVVEIEVIRGRTSVKLKYNLTS